MEKKKIVIIGANDFQNQLILRAKQKGYETHVFAWKDGAIGEKTADYFYPISIIEKERILEKCIQIKPIGICSIASDLATITVNYVAEKLGLVGNSMECTQISTNKFLMRKAFLKNGDPIPKFYLSDSFSEQELNELELPIIVKPVDRSGSRGICKITQRNAVWKAIEEAKELSFDKKAVIEEFVEGEEYSVEYISYRGRHTFLALTKKYTSGAPNFIETGHMQPADVSGEILEKIKRVVEHALNTLQIMNGASHSEIKIDENGNIKIIEIGARMGGDCIGSDLVKISTGYDFIGMVIDIACGEEPVFEKVCVPSSVEVSFAFNEKDIERIYYRQKKNPQKCVRICMDEDCSFRDVTDSSTRYGYAIFLL